MANKYKILLLIFLFLGIALRLVFVLGFTQPLVHGDDIAYDNMGSNFIKWFFEDKESLYGTSKPPLYPLFLYIVYTLFGHNILHAYLAQVALDTVSMIGVFYISYFIFSSYRASILAVLLYAVYPSFIWHTGILYTETLFTFLLISAVLAINKAMKTNSKLWYFLSGALLGIGTLCRPIAFHFTFFFCIFLMLIYRKTLKHTLVRCLLVIIGLFIAVSPWTARNYLLAKEFVPITVSSGWYLLYANAPLAYDNFWQDPHPSFKRTDEMMVTVYNDKRINRDSPLEVDNAAFRLAVQLALKHPFRFAASCGMRFKKLWFNVGYEYAPSSFAYFIMSFHIILFALCFTVMPFTDLSWLKKAFPILLILLYFTLFHSVIHSVYRFIIPAVPFLLILSAFSIDTIFSKVTLLLRKGL